MIAHQRRGRKSGPFYYPLLSKQEGTAKYGRTLFLFSVKAVRQTVKGSRAPARRFAPLTACLTTSHLGHFRRGTRPLCQMACAVAP